MVGIGLETHFKLTTYQSRNFVHPLQLFNYESNSLPNKYYNLNLDMHKVLAAIDNLINPKMGCN